MIKYYSSTVIYRTLKCSTCVGRIVNQQECEATLGERERGTILTKFSQNSAKLSFTEHWGLERQIDSRWWFGPLPIAPIVPLTNFCDPAIIQRQLLLLKLILHIVFLILSRHVFLDVDKSISLFLIGVFLSLKSAILRLIHYFLSLPHCPAATRWSFNASCNFGFWTFHKRTQVAAVVFDFANVSWCCPI